MGVQRGSLALIPIGALVALSIGCSSGTAATTPPPERPVAPEQTIAAELPWPPQLGEPYPDLTLKDPAGRSVALSSFKGRVLLIEPIGMSCPACQAFAGGHREGRGGLNGVAPQGGLESIEEYVEQYARGVKLDDPRLVYIQLLLYDPSAKRAPTAEEASRWAEHFANGSRAKPIVLVGDPRLIGRASYDMIPGFQLVDRDFVLRVDSTGHSPRHNLWNELLPELGRLVSAVESARPARTARGNGQLGETLADFTLNDATGRSRSLDALRGERAALLYFYSECLPVS